METISTFDALYEVMQDGNGGLWPKDKLFCSQTALNELSNRLGCEAIIDSVVDSFLASMEFDNREKANIAVAWRIYKAERNALRKLSGNQGSE